MRELTNKDKNIVDLMDEWKRVGYETKELLEKRARLDALEEQLAGWVAQCKDCGRTSTRYSPGPPAQPEDIVLSCACGNWEQMAEGRPTRFRMIEKEQRK